MPIKCHPELPNLFEVMHPLVSHKMTLLRDKETCSFLFRQLIHELTLLLTYEATDGLPLKIIKRDTPLEIFEGQVLQDNHPIIVPILRAGLGMVDAMLEIIPTASVGHIGLKRNPRTHRPESYYFNIPPSQKSTQVFICDPMCATGGSAIEAIDELISYGLQDIRLLVLIAAPEGIKALYAKHPNIPIYTTALDRGLNKDAYIVPGLGDAGDRLYGTLHQ